MLKGFNQLGDATVTNLVINNLVSFIDYGLLEKGNFISVQRNTPQAAYGGDDARLRLVRDPRYSIGQVWQGVRGNWVWESGVGALTSTDPAHPGVSGVYVNDVFHVSSSTGVYSHYIDHIRGRVIFNSPIPASSKVECDYSYKYINVVEIEGLPWFQEVQKRSERSNSLDFIAQSGDWGQLADSRYQLPAIGIEVSPAPQSKPYQWGGGQYVYPTFRLHCAAEDKYLRNQLIDIVSIQNEKSFFTYNLVEIANDNKFPIDYRGVPTSGAMSFPQLVENYPYKVVRFTTNGDSVYSLGRIHIGTVKYSSEIVLGI